MEATALIESHLELGETFYGKRFETWYHLDRPTEALLFGKQTYLYEHAVINPNSGRQMNNIPTTMQTMHRTTYFTS